MKNFDTNEESMHALIIDDLDQIITPENKGRLEQWRNTDDANEKTYQKYLSIQMSMDKLHARNSYDVQLSWETLDNKISNQNINTGLWYKIAAAVLIILSVGYYFMSDNNYIVVSTENSAAITHVKLPDGTDVNLNAATVIKYHKDFMNNRKLELLKGEVFIHVVNHEGPQFTLGLGEIEAQDIGTSFNVVKDANKITVIVEDGKVALKHISLNMKVLLTKGKLGTYNTETRKLSAADNPDKNYKSWIDKRFIFQDVPITEVADQLGKVYQIPVNIVGESFKNRKLTASLHYQTLDSVLTVISASLQCRVTREKDTYVLSDN